MFIIRLSSSFLPGVTAYKLVTHGQIACTCSSYVHKLRKNWLNTLPLESQSFFLAIFQRRPEKRMTLDEIFNHDWIRDDTENVRHAKKPYGSKKAISSARSGQTSGGVKAVKECLKMVDGCQYLTPGFVYPSDVLPLKRRRPNFMKCVHNAHGGLWSAMKPREEITDKIPWLERVIRRFIAISWLRGMYIIKLSQEYYKLSEYRIRSY